MDQRKTYNYHDYSHAQNGYFMNQLHHVQDYYAVRDLSIGQLDRQSDHRAPHQRSFQPDPRIMRPSPEVRYYPQNYMPNREVPRQFVYSGERTFPQMSGRNRIDQKLPSSNDKGMPDYHAQAKAITDSILTRIRDFNSMLNAKQYADKSLDTSTNTGYETVEQPAPSRKKVSDKNTKLDENKPDQSLSSVDVPLENNACATDLGSNDEFPKDSKTSLPKPIEKKRRSFPGLRCTYKLLSAKLTKDMQEQYGLPPPLKSVSSYHAYATFQQYQFVNRNDPTWKQVELVDPKYAMECIMKSRLIGPYGYAITTRIRLMNGHRPLVLKEIHPKTCKAWQRISESQRALYQKVADLDFARYKNDVKFYLDAIRQKKKQTESKDKSTNSK